MTGFFAKARLFLVAAAQMTRLAWRAQPACVVSLLLLDVLLGLLPVVAAWLIKNILDTLIQGLQADQTTGLIYRLLPLVAGQAAVTLALALSPLVARAVQSELSRRLTLLVQTTIYQKIGSLRGLEPFEHSEMYNTINLAMQGAQFGPHQVLATTRTLLQALVALISFLSILIGFSPTLAVLVLLATLPQLYGQVRLGRQRFDVALLNTPRGRRAHYYGALIAGIDYAKEVLLLGLAPHFLARFRQLTIESHTAERQQSVKELGWQLGLGVLSSVVAAGSFFMVISAAAARQLSVGDVTLYLSAIITIQATLTQACFSVATLHEAVLFHEHYQRLLALPQPIALATTPVPAAPLAIGIEFRQVSFRYHETQPWVLQQVDLLIPAGQCVALIGLNGAGKTTLVKLLLRMYDPTEGQILWDGVDIRCYDPADLRRRCAAIFQDFVHYDLSVHENIALGDLSRFDSLATVQAAAQEASIHEVITRLPQGYNTILSRWLVDEGQGTDLSGGQWQKIALARMFMRDVDLLILDEPTAALDVQAEVELYDRFARRMARRTSLVISHRFSTVQMADRIVVLDGGRIVEQGSHAELVRYGGSYAGLYAVQAAQYQRAVVVEDPV